MKKNILFIAATHGDEGFSVPVLEKIEKTYPKEEWSYDWIIGNEKAFKLNKRYTDADLNRSAPGDISSNVYETRRAAEIVKLSENYNVVIDIHGSISNCGIVKILPLPSLQNILLALSIPLEKNIIWFAEESFKHGPPVQSMKNPAIELECGPKDDPKIAEELYSLLEKIITKFSKNHLLNLTEQTKQQTFYAVFGKETDMTVKATDFIETSNGKESYYPFLADQYPGITCYKTKKITLENLFTSDIIGSNGNR